MSKNIIKCIRSFSASSNNSRTQPYSIGLDLTPIITHHFSVDDFQKGFDMMRSGKSGKVILDWENSACYCW